MLLMELDDDCMSVVLSYIPPQCAWFAALVCRRFALALKPRANYFTSSATHANASPAFIKFCVAHGLPLTKRYFYELASILTPSAFKEIVPHISERGRAAATLGALKSGNAEMLDLVWSPKLIDEQRALEEAMRGGNIALTNRVLSVCRDKVYVQRARAFTCPIAEFRLIMRRKEYKALSFWIALNRRIYEVFPLLGDGSLNNEVYAMLKKFPDKLDVATLVQLAPKFRDPECSSILLDKYTIIELMMAFGISPCHSSDTRNHEHLCIVGELALQRDFFRDFTYNGGPYHMFQYSKSLDLLRRAQKWLHAYKPLDKIEVIRASQNKHLPGAFLVFWDIISREQKEEAYLHVVIKAAAACGNVETCRIALGLTRDRQALIDVMLFEATRFGCVPLLVEFKDEFPETPFDISKRSIKNQGARSWLCAHKLIK